MKVSRSDLAFQKLRKYEEKYKTIRNFSSVRVSSGSDIANSESDIDQSKSLVPKYPGTVGIQRVSPINVEVSKDSLPKVVESSEYFNTTSCDNCPREAANKSLIINLKIDNVRLVNSDASKTDTVTNSLTNGCRDTNKVLHKKSFDKSKGASQQNLNHETKPYALKTSVNTSIRCDTHDTNNQHSYVGSHVNCAIPEDDSIHMNTFVSNDKTPYYSSDWNESQKVNLNLTGEIKEITQPSRSVEYCEKQQTNQPLKQMGLNVDVLSKRGKLPEEPDSIKTEIFQSNSDVTSYEVPEISSSFDMEIRDESESSKLDAVIISDSSVTSGDHLSQNIDDRNVTNSASNNVTDDHLNSAKSLCYKCKKCKKQCKSQTYQTYCYCNTKSTQTNINMDFLHNMNDIKLSNTNSVEDVVLSPYNLFLNHCLLHGHAKGIVNSDSTTNILNKNLMEQVNITRYLIKSQQDMYSAYCTAARNLSKNYQPITLENTLQFIKQSKKKRRNRTVSP